MATLRATADQKFAIVVESREDVLTIRFNGKLQLLIYTEDLVGVQSWVERGHSNHVIEYTFKDGQTIISEYVSEEVFHIVLEGLAEEL